MLCCKCKNEIDDGSNYCKICGKKQVVKKKSRTHKRARGSGTVRFDKRNKKKPWCAYAPATISGAERKYLGSFPLMQAAQQAIDNYVKNGRPELYNATLEDVYNLWSETHFRNISEVSTRQFKSNWNKFKPIANIKMSELRLAHLQMIVDNIKGSYASAYHVRVLAKQLCKCAMENDIIDKNYADFMKLPKNEKAEKVIFTDEQLETLWGHTEDPRIQIILVMIYTGFRIGEVLDLRVENIHFEEGYMIGGEKTEAGKDRTVPFPAAIPEIKQFVADMVDNADPNGKLFSVTSTTFRNKYFYIPLIELGMINATVSDKGVITFQDKHHLTPHSTRHTFATLSVAAGMNPKELQKIIGHARIQTTLDVYAKTNPNSLKSEMGKLTRVVNCV